MHDVKAIREQPSAYARAWTSRGVADAQGIVDAILAADQRLRTAQGAFQAAQARRNEASKLIGAAKAKKDNTRAATLMAEVEGLKSQLSTQTKAETSAAFALRDLLAAQPNLPAEETPEGKDEHGNVEQVNRRFGDPKTLPAARLNAPKDHVALGEALRMMDFEAAAKMSGSRFVMLKRDLAKLERALGQFMLDLHTHEHEYDEVSPPLLVRDEALFGTGQLPKFKEDLFAVQSINAVKRSLFLEHLKSDYNESTSEWAAEIDQLVLSVGEDQRQSITMGYLRSKTQELAPVLQDRVQAAVSNGELFDMRWLIPTAEVSLTNLVREQITPEEDLPLRLTALTPSFRSEAGSHGRDTRGMIRQHQFYKCELVSITTPERSDAEHERMVECAEAVLKRLGLPFRTMLLCTGDMGFSARKTYDLEVWLPSQATYREISSCSNCGDFQARRMDARCKAAGARGTRFVHTLNGSGLAVGRTLVAVLENYQDEGGSIAIPDALQPYMGGQTKIEAKS